MSQAHQYLTKGIFIPTLTIKSEIDITAGIRADRFDVIKYEKRPGKKGAVIGMQFGAHFVFKWIFEDAWKNISAGIATADRYKFHTVESLFNNPEVWMDTRQRAFTSPSAVV